MLWKANSAFMVNQSVSPHALWCCIEEGCLQTMTWDLENSSKAAHQNDWPALTSRVARYYISVYHRNILTPWSWQSFPCLETIRISLKMTGDYRCLSLWAGVENMSDEEWLMELGLFSLKNRRFRGVSTPWKEEGVVSSAVAVPAMRGPEEMALSYDRGDSG